MADNENSSPTPVELLGALSDFLPRFEQMLATLEAHPEVRVVVARVAPPASEADIEAVHAHLGATLDPAILNFYRQCDGLALMWVTTDNPDADSDNPDDDFDDYQASDGAINIQAIKYTFVDAEWREDHRFELMQGREVVEFDGPIQVFDAFHFFNMAGFIMISARGPTFNPPVGIGDDHGACWTDSRITDFESYMETVLATCGSIAARKRVLMQYAGNQQEPLRLDKGHWQANPAEIGVLLDEARERH